MLANIPTSARFNALSPSILRYGQVLWRLEAQEVPPSSISQPQESVTTAQEETAMTRSDPPSDPFDNLFSNIAPASTGQIQDLFRDASFNNFLQEEHLQEYGLVNDFMENLWVSSIGNDN